MLTFSIWIRISFWNDAALQAKEWSSFWPGGRWKASKLQSERETLYLHKREIPVLTVVYQLLFGLGWPEIVAFLCIAQLFLEVLKSILVTSFISDNCIIRFVKATGAGLYLKEQD